MIINIIITKYYYYCLSGLPKLIYTFFLFKPETVEFKYCLTLIIMVRDLAKILPYVRKRSI